MQQLWSPALPLVLRHDAGDLEAPPRPGRTRARRAASAGSACRSSSLFRSSRPLLAPLIDVFLVYGAGLRPDRARRSLAWLGVLARPAGLRGLRVPARPGAADAPLISLPLQQILYRQLMYVVLLQSWITALTGGRLRWQKLRRTGQVAAPPGAVAPAASLDGVRSMSTEPRTESSGRPGSRPAGGRPADDRPMDSTARLPRLTEPARDEAEAARAGPRAPRVRRRRRRAADATATSTSSGRSPCSVSSSTT